MQPRDRVTRLSYFAPAWFLGRHSALYFERYAPSDRRRSRPSEDDEYGSRAAEPR